MSGWMQQSLRLVVKTTTTKLVGQQHGRSRMLMLLLDDRNSFSSVASIAATAVDPCTLPSTSSSSFSTLQSRCMSTNATNSSPNIPLRRPPRRSDDGTSDPTFKLRTHFVSLQLGDYSDDGYEDEYTRAKYVASPSAENDDDVALTTTGTTQDWEQEEMELAKEVYQTQLEMDKKREKWIQNAKPPVRVPIIDARGRSYGRGGRKTAAARVWIQPGYGHVVVNRQDFLNYFDNRASDRELLLEPLVATGTCGKFDVQAHVHGGGLTGQAGAIRHGLARALNNYNPDRYRPALKYLGLLTRDPRKVERKKIGLLKARKRRQWNRR